MTDQELNLKCAKYLWPDELPKNIVEDYGTYYIDTLKDSSFEHEFSPATDANDAMLVFDKLGLDGWFIDIHTFGNCYSWKIFIKDRIDVNGHAKTAKEAIRAVLEKIMTINGSD